MSESNTEQNLSGIKIQIFFSLFFVVLVIAGVYYDYAWDSTSSGPAHDGEISEDSYFDIKYHLSVQRLFDEVDEKLLSLVENALEDGKITHGELTVINEYHESTLDPRPQRSALIDEVKKLRSKH